jgi:hypothetical protein
MKPFLLSAETSRQMNQRSKDSRSSVGYSSGSLAARTLVRSAFGGPSSPRRSQSPWAASGDSDFRRVAFTGAADSEEVQPTSRMAISAPARTCWPESRRSPAMLYWSTARGIVLLRIFPLRASVGHTCVGSRQGVKRRGHIDRSMFASACRTPAGRSSWGTFNAGAVPLAASCCGRQASAGTVGARFR